VSADPAWKARRIGDYKVPARAQHFLRAKKLWPNGTLGEVAESTEDSDCIKDFGNIGKKSYAALRLIVYEAEHGRPPSPPPPPIPQDMLRWVRARQELIRAMMNDEVQVVLAPKRSNDD
jgi:hypothetical protein